MVLRAIFIMFSWNETSDLFGGLYIVGATAPSDRTYKRDFRTCNNHYKR